MNAIQHLKMNGTNASLQAFLQQIGYQQFKTTEEYLHDSLTHTRASLQDKDSDPYIVNIGNKKNIKVWSPLLYQIIEPMDWEIGDEKIVFKPDLYVNNEGFVIRVSLNNLNAIVSFKNENVFRRPPINHLDQRYDLGDRVFIVSEVGILFSIFEKPSDKTLAGSHNQLNIFDDINNLRRNTLINFENQDVYIGTYGNAFQVQVVHVLPSGSFMNPRIYKDWK